ncbi:MAG: chemotaxis protein CheW [Cyanobacteria bacterium P01_C01_bin.72]
MQKESAASRIQANIQELFKGKLAPGEPHIKFQLTPEITALLSMEQVQASLIVPAEKITALPGMPESIIGIMNSRDRVLCVYDLAHLLNLPTTLTASQQYQIVILEISQLSSSEQKLPVGLAVEQIGGITRLARENFQQPSNVPECLTSHVLASVGDSEQQFVLDMATISATITTK